MSGERDGQPGIAGLTIKMLTSSFNLGKSQTSRLVSNDKEEGPDITLNNPMVQGMQMGLGK